MSRQILDMMLIVTVAAVVAAACDEVGANHIPVLHSIQNKQIETGKTLEFEISARDDDGDDLDFSMSWDPAPVDPSGPRLVEIDRVTARFSWTPLSSDAGDEGKTQAFEVTFTVDDGEDSSSQTIVIVVSLGAEGSGAPVFITPSDHILNLDRSSRMQFTIEVRDPDSSYVELRLVDDFPGAEFDAIAGQKQASFAWSPTEAQIAEKPIWSFRVGARDDDNPEVFQENTILLRGGLLECEGSPPSIVHTALADQRGADDYPVSAQVTDEESEIIGVSMYWIVTGAQDQPEAMQKGTLTSAGGGQWEGTLPNPGLQGGATATISYYLCAADNDDPDGSTCDNKRCVPEESRYSFTAYASGNDACKDDAPFEPNDDRDSATPVELNQDGECYYQQLQICAGNEDWFTVDLAGDHLLGAFVVHSPANGELALEILAADGVTELTVDRELADDGLIAILEPAAEPRSLFLRVRGAESGVQNGYSLVLLVEEDVPCAADELEPNDDYQNATRVAEGVHTGLTSCGDLDYYALTLALGDHLEVLIEFTHDNGDLDLWLVDRETLLANDTIDCALAVACAISETDDELIDVPGIPASGEYLLIVSPYHSSDINTYDMTITIESALTCTDDEWDDEPGNDEPDQGVPLMSDDVLEDLMICPGDDDWFQIDLVPGERLLADVLFQHDDGDIDMLVYDPDVDPADLDAHIVGYGISTDDDEHVEHTAAVSGTYYIRVYGSEGAAGRYDLLVEVR